MTNRKDRNLFFETLKLYDRPEDQLRRRCLESDEDVDYLVDKLFSGAFKLDE